MHRKVEADRSLLNWAGCGGLSPRALASARRRPGDHRSGSHPDRPALAMDCPAPAHAAMTIGMLMIGRREVQHGR